MTISAPDGTVGNSRVRQPDGQESEREDIAYVMPGDAGSRLVRGKDDRRVNFVLCHNRCLF